ncbi:choice-of-anchor J domain-containing protein [Flavobacterium sp. SM2513]|uniref:choice-of-anchor J domain-containing protein n=1 Tax=Flavobacterium sp. SM2513 TaxID=3424766 RepID=UPI003D7F591B
MKKIIFISLLFFLALLKSYGQVLIGNGNTLSGLPIQTYYGYSYSQSIYTAAEINANGSINSISWFYGGPEGSSIGNSQNLKVYLGHTTKTSYSSASDWVAASSLTEVYTGGITINGQGWTTINFATPYVYNGLDNLVIATAELQPGYDANGNFFKSQPMTENRSLLYQNDGTPPNLATPQEGSLLQLLPNIIFGGIASSCPTPFFLNAVNTTDTSAIVVWGNGVQDPNDSSEYYLSTTDVAPAAETIATGTATTLAMISNLSPNTVYNIWVRNVCNGVAGRWSYPTTFETECAAVTGFVENFDLTANNTLPSCWSAIYRGSGISPYASIKTLQGGAYTGTKSVVFASADSGSDSDIILVSPKTTLAGNNSRLRFLVIGAQGTSFVVGTLNGKSNAATFTPLANGLFETYGEYTAYTVDLSDYTGSDTFIGIKLNTTSSYKTMKVDNIRLEPNTTCPDVSEILIEAIQPQQVMVNWNPQGTTAWEMAYTNVQEVTNPAELAPVTASDLYPQLTGLVPNSNYNLWVRSVCDTQNGAWIGPINFSTPCMPVVDLMEDFDSVATPALPNCWHKLVRGTQAVPSINIISVSTSSLTQPNQILLAAGNNITADTDIDILLISPNLSTVATGTHRLKFSAKGTANLEVGTIDGIGVTANFTALEQINVNADYNEYVVEFSSYQGPHTYFAIRINSTAAYQTSYIDNVTWELSPLCQDVSNVTVQSVTPTTATLAWTNSDTTWEVVIGSATETNPSILSPVLEATSNSIEVLNLLESTTYKAWVRTVCGTENGAWIGPILFQTDCAPATTIDENFDANANVLPSCWTAIVRGISTENSGSVGVNSFHSYSQSNAVQLYNANQTDTNDILLVSPSLSNLSAGTHRLRFYSSYFYPSAVQVGTLDSNTQTATFTLLEEFVIGANYTEFTVNSNQFTATTDSYIGIRLSAMGQNSYAFIDDIRWELAPMCPTPNNPVISDVTDSAASFTWELPETGTISEVAYGAAALENAEAAILLPTTTESVAYLESLTPNSSYKVWVRSVCTEGNGEWVGPIVFSTNCVANNVLDENFDSLTTPNLPDCWSSRTDGSSSQFFASVTGSSITAHSGSNAIKITNSSNANTEKVRLIAPPLDNLAAGTHQATFYLKGSTDISDIQVGTLTNSTSTGIFTNLETISATTTFTKITVDFSNYTGADYFICIWHSGNNNTTIYVDDFKWEPIPAASCDAVSDVNENFDTTTVDAVPACWTTVLRGPTAATNIDAIGVKAGFAGAPSAPNVLNIFKGLSQVTDEQIIVLPQLSNLSQGTHSLGFRHTGPPCAIEVGTMNSTDGVFTLKQSVPVGAEWTESTVDFSDYTGTDTYVALRLNAGESPFVSMYLDNVTWSPSLKTTHPAYFKFAFYPNPVKDRLSISSEKTITQAVVTNLLGQQMQMHTFNATEVQLDLSTLASGTYLVRVTAANENRTLKIVKE